MRAVIGTVTVCEGVMDLIHGGGYSLKRVIVPEKQLGFNLRHDTITVFPVTGGAIPPDMMNPTEIELDPDMVEKAEQILALRNELTSAWKALLE